MHLRKDQFVLLMQDIANGWSNDDTELALSSFAEDAVYMEPPNIQLYQGPINCVHISERSSLGP